MKRDEAIEQVINLTNVSRETIRRLEEYENLLLKWNPAINLVSKSTISEIWSRHILDSAQLWVLSDKTQGIWLDLGSGAGFPGLVIAIIASELAPNLSVQLVESDIRKSAFLANTAQVLGIQAQIQTQRTEGLKPQKADIISARALAALPKLLEFAENHANRDTLCLFPKGKNHISELTEARKYWKFEVQKSPSITDSGGVILRIGGIGRV